jgi:quercetin 2,3-dioxygenase
MTIIPKDKQGYGAFNGGEIIENKPIGFPQDRSATRPYSNLFYWAHAKALTDSTIGLHPHQGFEICSFVLKNQIRHYDTHLKEWRALEAGDVQIIRAGKGISHSEFMAAGAEMFQIWFDPNLAKTITQPASYDDYKSAEFPVATPDRGVQVTHLVGDNSPFRMDTPGIRVLRIELDNACHTLTNTDQRILSIYVLAGEVLVNSELARESDFVIIREAGPVELQALAGGTVFMIESPAQPGYRTYAN